MSKKKKVRVELRKNISKPPRGKRWTQEFQDHGFEEEGTSAGERVRAKGDLSRKRTIIQDEPSKTDPATPEESMPSVDTTVCLPGRVLWTHKIAIVETEDGRLFRCAVRRLLKSLARDERSIVTCGDLVWIRPEQRANVAESQITAEDRAEASACSVLNDPRLAQAGEAMIERVEPRHGILTRASRKREQVLVANVDRLVVVMSLFEPDLKPHLIDRYLACAQRGGLQPIVCLNKADLAHCEAFIPLIGGYAQLGVPVILTSARTGMGVDRLREFLTGRAAVFSGQSGVGKSSLLNALQPELGLSVREVSDVNQKGRHTTTTAELIRLKGGGWVVDTPGVRQFELWDIIPEEIEGFFTEFRPFVPLCAFPDCTHTHEERCAVKRAVSRRQISPRRYHSYLGMFEGDK
ncbi:MAG TPA: ribosome small subunit-dependent GTPase A [Gemmataceae bacterium]|jgi:ribosome biogenesis GTPase|nr:ribosome small subunit-dependent GTPase A [Gemmataceae bacterium]